METDAGCGFLLHPQDIQVHLLTLSYCNFPLLPWQHILLCSSLLRILLQRSPLHVLPSHFFIFLPSLYCQIQAPCLLESYLWSTQAHFPQHSTSSLLSSWLQTPAFITTFPVGHFCASLLHKHLKNNFIIPTEKLPHLPSSLHKWF